MRTQALVRSGYTVEQAEALAREEFGDMERIRGEMLRIGERRLTRERRALWIGEFWQDLAYGARSLVMNRGFAIAAVLSLGLSLGANATVFSLVNAVLFRPLPFHEPSQLYAVWNEFQQEGLGRVTLAPAEVSDLMGRTRTFSEWAALSYREYNIDGATEPEHVAGLDVTPSFFAVLGVRPAHGRAFVEADASAGSVAILSHETWSRQFGRSTSAIGQTMLLDGREFVVIGVMPEGFEIPNPDGFMLPHAPRIWTPLDLGALSHMSRGQKFLRVIGRVRAASTQQQASADLASLTASLRAEHGNYYPPEWEFRAYPLQEQTVSGVRTALQLLLIVMSLVFVIACMNVGNLVLARSVTRRQEMVMRRMLGASDGRIIRQVLAENVVLATMGALVAVAITSWSTNALVKTNLAAIPRLAETVMDGRVWGVIAAASAGVAVVLTALVLSGTRVRDAGTVLRGSSRTVSGAHGRVRGALVAIEVALASVVLVAGFLVLASLLRLTSTSPGVRADDVITFSISLPESSYPDLPARAGIYDRIVERVSALPGVTSAAVVNPLPFGGETWQGSFDPEGRVRSATEQSPSTEFAAVSPAYFEVMGIDVVAGRGFDGTERANAPQVVVVDEALAHTFWNNESPVGKRLHIGWAEPGQWATVIGVVRTVASSGLAQGPRPHIYLSNVNRARTTATLVVRRPRWDGAGSQDVRAAVRELDAGLPLGTAVTMRTVLNASLGVRRYTAGLLSGLGVVALALVAIGLYALISYVVTERTRELGIRIALGANGTNVITQVVAQGLRVCVLGLVFGVAASLALRQVLTSVLFGVSPTDAGVFGAVAGLMLMIAVVASLIPARRAANVQPMTALRADQ